jgi:hypothetical protein
MQQPPNPYPQFQPQQWQLLPMPPQQQWNPQPPPFPPQQPSALPETTLCDREILGSYHAVELYQDGALWIIDEEDPPIEIKLDAQAAQRLRDFLTRLDGQQYKTPYPYQQQQYPKPMQPVKQPTKRDNGDAIFWLLIFWPVGLYIMWKYAT